MHLPLNASTLNVYCKTFENVFTISKWSRKPLNQMRYINAEDNDHNDDVDDNDYNNDHNNDVDDNDYNG